MRIIIEFNECHNTELINKMKQIISYGDFLDLTNEYGWIECVEAYEAAFGFDYDYIKNQLFEAFYNGFGDCGSILEYTIENDIASRMLNAQEA